MNYRPEIDGLRAIAVTSVIFFHAGFQLFSGGSFGVDIFFVISGFLITTIILTDIEAGEFSIRRFYERRARRILPALVLVVLVTIPVAWFLLIPSDLKPFGRSVQFLSLFASNFFFKNEAAGYFAQASELKPLLHTWSLAVEEQFYLVYPPFLLLLWRLSYATRFATLALVFLISLIAAEAVVRFDPGLAFYHLPFRAWELLAGALSAKAMVELNSKDSDILHPLFSEALALCGLLMITAAVLGATNANQAPGIAALLPVGGTVLVILFARNNMPVQKLLGMPAFVGIGLISYSAYLWHQPIFAFMRYRATEPLSTETKLGLVFVTLLLAWVTWYLVEQPLRKGKGPQRRVWQASAVGLAALLVGGSVVAHNDGWQDRFSPEEYPVLTFLSYPYHAAYQEGRCFLYPQQTAEDFAEDCRTQNKIFVWGDSHAAAFSAGIRAAGEEISQFTASGCPPFINYPLAHRPACQSINDKVLLEIAALRPETVVLTAYWMTHADPVEPLIQTIAAIRRVSSETQIVVVGSAPLWTKPLPMLLFRKSDPLSGETWIDNEQVGPMSKDAALAKMALTTGVHFFSILDVFCNIEACQVVITTPKEDLEPISWDDNHLTVSAAARAARRMIQNLQSQEE